MHPSLDTPESLAIEPDGFHLRQTDFDFWTSQLAKDILEEEEIIVLNYCPLQAAWKGC